MLKGSFKKMNLGSMKYALVHEACQFPTRVESRAHKQACFTQSPGLVQTN